MKPSETAGTVIIVLMFVYYNERQVLLVSLLIFVYYSEAEGTVNIDINLCLLQWSVLKWQVLLVSILIFAH